MSMMSRATLRAMAKDFFAPGGLVENGLASGDDLVGFGATRKLGMRTEDLREFVETGGDDVDVVVASAGGVVRANDYNLVYGIGGEPIAVVWRGGDANGSSDIAMLDYRNFMRNVASVRVFFNHVASFLVRKKRVHIIDHHDDYVIPDDTYSYLSVIKPFCRRPVASTFGPNATVDELSALPMYFFLSPVELEQIRVENTADGLRFGCDLSGANAWHWLIRAKHPVRIVDRSRAYDSQPVKYLKPAVDYDELSTPGIGDLLGSLRTVEARDFVRQVHAGANSCVKGFLSRVMPCGVPRLSGSLRTFLETGCYITSVYRAGLEDKGVVVFSGGGTGIHVTFCDTQRDLGDLRVLWRGTLIDLMTCGATILDAECYCTISAGCGDLGATYVIDNVIDFGSGASSAYDHCPRCHELVTTTHDHGALYRFEDSCLVDEYVKLGKAVFLKDMYLLNMSADTVGSVYGSESLSMLPEDRAVRFCGMLRVAPFGSAWGSTHWTEERILRWFFWNYVGTFRDVFLWHETRLYIDSVALVTEYNRIGMSLGMLHIADVCVCGVGDQCHCDDPYLVSADCFVDRPFVRRNNLLQSMANLGGVGLVHDYADSIHTADVKWAYVVIARIRREAGLPEQRERFGDVGDYVRDVLEEDIYDDGELLLWFLSRYEGEFRKNYMRWLLRDYEGAIVVWPWEDERVLIGIEDDHARYDCSSESDEEDFKDDVVVRN